MRQDQGSPIVAVIVIKGKTMHDAIQGRHDRCAGRPPDIDAQVQAAGLYARSNIFDTGEEPRRLHLGIDIWGPAGTAVMAPLGWHRALVLPFNNNDSDYGATLILTHNLDGVGFHILYGHLSLNSLKNRYEGQHVSKGEVIAEFGMRFDERQLAASSSFSTDGRYAGMERRLSRRL